MKFRICKKKYKSLQVIIPATAWITSKCRLGRRPDSFSCFQQMGGFWAVVVSAVDSQVCGVQQRKYRRESPRSRDEKRTPRWESPNAQFRIGRREAEIKRDIQRHRTRDLSSLMDWLHKAQTARQNRTRQSQMKKLPDLSGFLDKKFAGNLKEVGHRQHQNFTLFTKGGVIWCCLTQSGQ